MFKRSTHLLLTSIVAFIVSGVFTIIWFTSDTYIYTLPWFLALGMAVVFETFKINSGIMAFTSTLFSGGWKFILGIISILTVFYSILASTGYLLNNSNNIFNEQVKQSKSYQQAIEKKDLNKDLYSTSKSEISRLQQEKNNTITELKKQLSEKMPKLSYKNWNEKSKSEQAFYNGKKTLQNKITEIEKDYESKIEKEKEKQNKAYEEANNIVDTSGISIKFTKGSLAVSNFIGQIINKNSETVEIWLKIIAAILFEIIAWVSAILYPKVKAMEKSENNVENENHVKNKKIGFDFLKKTSPVTAKIGFDIGDKKTSNTFKLKGIQDIQSSEVRKYLDYMYQTSVDDISKGYMNIAKNIGITADKGRKIKAYLEQKNIIKVDGMTTKILKKI